MPFGSDTENPHSARFKVAIDVVGEDFQFLVDIEVLNTNEEEPFPTHQEMNDAFQKLIDVIDADSDLSVSGAVKGRTIDQTVTVTP